MKSLRKRYSTLTAVKVLIIAFLFSLVACCAKKPFVTTAGITNIKTTSVTSGGNVTANSGIMVTGRGVCWGTTPNPNVYSSVTHDGQGYGGFVSNLEGLSPNTTYYVRAVATTLKGPVYGEQFSFKTCLYTVSDIDGNSYNAIQIGTQVLMAENLKTTKYNDGTSISNITNNIEWFDYPTGAYCWYNNDATFKNTYGALYNWFAVNTGKLCPTGWHVTTETEWRTLTTYLGAESAAGGKLKEKGTSHWASPNTGATNESGFTALPAGFRQSYNASARFGYITLFGFWWSATEYFNGFPWSVRIDNGGTHVYYFSDASANDGNSVRCLKD